MRDDFSTNRQTLAVRTYDMTRLHLDSARFALALGLLAPLACVPQDDDGGGFSSFTTTFTTTLSGDGDGDETSGDGDGDPGDGDADTGPANCGDGVIDDGED